MDDVTSGILQSLQKRLDSGTYRMLHKPSPLIDFVSNDYLGLSGNEKLKTSLLQELKENPAPLGATGSRLLSGNFEQVEETEQRISAFHKSEAGLMFSSGYVANIGLLSTLPQRGDTILYDTLCHASIKYGIRLSPARAYAFKHNDPNDLFRKKRLCKGNVFVVTESVFSMDGDIAPLQELVQLCHQNHFYLIVDEAHTTGINGTNGEGLVCELGLEKDVFARVHTFGKALGLQGAIVTGSTLLRQYLINYCHAFIYSTGISPLLALSIRKAYEILPELAPERNHIFTLHKKLEEELTEISGSWFRGHGPVNCLVIPENEKVKKTSAFLESKGCNVKPILSPTVAKGQERLRICLHSYNTLSELDILVQGVKEFALQNR